MFNLRTIYKVIGSLLFIEAFILFICFGMALFYGEDDAMPFLVSVFIGLFFAFILRYLGRNSDNTLSRRDAYLVVTLSWIVFSFFGTFPFTLSGYIHSFTDAYFETMSGFTTTGATIIDDVESFPHALLFWRSLTQWIGGLGIVFFTVALLPSMIGGSVKVFAAESTGPINSKLHPRLSTSAKWILTVYFVLTIACIGCFILYGMNWFDAVNYSMTSTATGGFSTHNNSIAYFRSPGLEYICTIFCFLSGVNFTLLYTTVVKHRFNALIKSSEFKHYLSIVVLFSLFIMVELMLKRGYALEPAFRSSTFQVVSFMTTTGLFSDDAGKWPHVTWLILSVGMFIGACSGSTSGGLKCIRVVMLLKTIRNEFKQILHPNAVLPLKVDGANIPYQKRGTLLAFFTMYLILCLLAAFALMMVNTDSTDAITIILSCIGNVGPALGHEIGPTMNWSMLPDFAKWVCSLLMLIGRLEIFTVLVILSPSFWKDN